LRHNCETTHGKCVEERHKFLIIDDNPDGRALLVHTLRRKYPTAIVQEAADSGAAIDAAAAEKWTAIVAHRGGGMDGESLVRALRAVAPETAILGVSGIDRSQPMMAAGATAFLHYDAWLMAGNAVERLIENERGSASSS
jgi:DNA-binding NarL/FixJ family response regulator